MHDGDHEIFKKHQHEHETNQTIKIIAGIFVAGLIVGFIVWRLMS